jgi:signal transduction histidine kinase
VTENERCPLLVGKARSEQDVCFATIPSHRTDALSAGLSGALWHVYCLTGRSGMRGVPCHGQPPRVRCGETADGTPFQTLFDISPDCMFHVRVDDDGRFIYDAANQTALSSAGLTLDQLVGQTPEVLLGPEKGGMMIRALQIVCETGRPYRYEPTWDLPSGRVTYDAIYIPEKNIVGEIVGVLGIARNITKQRELEASLHQSRKMEALGQLSSGVAHDFNNVLANIQACLTLLKRQFKAEGAEQLINEGMRTIKRGKSLTDRMLAFARQQPVALKPVDLNRLIDNIGNMLVRPLGSNVFIDNQIDKGLWQTLGDIAELEVAILNIVINARDSMPKSGKLTISAHNETISKGEIEGLRAGDYVALSFTDTGKGMSPDVLARVLEPFYTTKDKGKGTGLGLSLINSMVQKTGGAITIESEVDVGTCVTLYLPRALIEREPDREPNHSN